MDFRRMYLRPSVPFVATFIFFTHSLLGEFIQGRKLNIERQFHEYKAMLKSENKTVFPDRDIRSLLNPGLRPRESIRLGTTQSQRQRGRYQEGISDLLSHRPTQTPAGTSDISVFAKNTPTRRHRKKWNSKRKQRKMDIPNLLTADSNELEADNLDKLYSRKKSSGNPKRNSGRRKERRRKNRRRRLRHRKIKSSKSSVVVTHVSNLPKLKERCKTRPMKQEIKVKGCLSKTITNNLCYGQCNSYVIPEIQGRGDGPPAFVSCGFCRPRTIRPIFVQLRCTNRNGQMRLRRKKVPYVKKCRCMAQQVNLEIL